MKQIVFNSGGEGSVIVQKVQEGEGFTLEDFQKTKEYIERLYPNAKVTIHNLKELLVDNIGDKNTNETSFDGVLKGKILRSQFKLNFSYDIDDQSRNLLIIPEHFMFLRYSQK